MNLTSMLRWIAVAWSVQCVHAAAPTSAELVFFENKIRPVLATRCYKCHSVEAEKIKGGLWLDTRDGLRTGGDSGPAIVPGDVKKSLLLKAIRGEDADLQMPPKETLSPAVIADFEQWVKLGAPDPREGKAPVSKRVVDIEKGREHWAFQVPKKSPLPSVRDANWPRANLDRFVLVELEAKNLKPVADAEPRVLLRRLYFDLIGLPPTPEEVSAFVNDFSAAGKQPNNVLEKVVDKLLASPQFGEKWGRHWLDIARYAESSGKENNLVYPHAWRYRDYVIQAFNADKPFDRFLKEQIAGDRLPAKDETQQAEQLIATGFLAIGPKSHNTRDTRQFQMDLADEQIDALSQGILGLTVACARCHDHKFDPIPTRDYYALTGIFLSTESFYGTPPAFNQNNQATALLRLPDNASVTDATPPAATTLTFLKNQLKTATKERDDILTEAREKKDRSVLMANPRLNRATSQVAILEKQLARYDEQGQPKKLAMGVQDRATPRDAHILQRGELDKSGELVPRGFLQVLNTTPPPAITSGSGRRNLADWIASRDNPLPARVFVNRVWQHLFGRGLVTSPDNFGTTGQKPNHPQLLDTLAVNFMEQGWSVKQLIREIVLSHTYQLSSDFDARNFATDPDDVLLWRMPQRRLEAEAIRDAMLVVAGKLDLIPPHGSVVANSEGPVQVLLRFNLLQTERYFRSVYLPIVRDQIPEALAVFDFAEPSLVVGGREDTTVPSQGLYLLNNPQVQHLAEAFADRLLAKEMTSSERAQLAYQLAFSRAPSEAETKAMDDFFTRFMAKEGQKLTSRLPVGRLATVAFCQALFASAEFRYLN